jgi:uroporphyrinogen decarboxylase
MVCIKKDQQAFLDVASSLLKDVEEKCRLARENDLSVILLADDIAGNNGLLFSPGDFTEIILPYYMQIAEIIKANALYAFFHSDGDTRIIIESLIGAGYDCIHPVEAQAGSNIYELQKDYGGRVSFMGHIDIITWNDERIAQEVNNAEKMFKEGGLILGSTCGLSMKTVSNKLSALYPQWQTRGQEV